MAICEVCTGMSDAARWRDLSVHEDPLVLLAHVPPSSQTAVDAYPGHLLLLPWRHVESPAALTSTEAERVGLWLSRGTWALESSLGAEHVYQARLGDGWAHLHYHLLARYPGTPVPYRGMQVRDWPGVAKCGRPQVAAIADTLRRALAGHD